MNDEPEPPPRSSGARRSKAGGAKKRPTRYGAPSIPCSVALADALRLHRKGHLDEAQSAYQHVLEEDPGCLDAWMNLGACCVRRGQASAARRAFAEALALAPGDARAQRDVAIGLAAVGDQEVARKAFEEALRLDASQLGARLALSRLCAEMGDRSAALEQARQATKDAPQEASAHLEYFLASFDDRDPSASLKAVSEAVRLDAGYALARCFLAGTLYLSGRAEEAEAALGPAGLVVPGWRDILTYATRGSPPARCFANKRETLEFALTQANLPGEILELGVRHGVSLRLLASNTREPVHGFDSFDGLPEPWQSHPAGVFSTAGELPHVPPNVRLHVGLFEDTLPRFLAQHQAPIRLVHIDSDIYTSARSALEHLGPRLEPGCILVFDEYLGNTSFREDEWKALQEASQQLGWIIEELALNWITGQGVIKIADIRRPP